MNKDFFYSNLDENTLSKEKKDFLHNLKEYSELSKKQIYVLNKPLFVKKDYKYEEAVAVFISKFKILFLNFNSTKENEFEIFIDDYIEDLGYISEKYDYKDELERPRIWKNELTNKIIYSKEKSLEEILNKNILKEENKIRKVDMLISLATGSINDINRIKGLKVDSLLEKVKKRIVLFDSDQTRFIYENIPEKIVRIQGLAGTGKTELLLHKLKELYLKDSNNKIVMTCFNKILQQSLEKRIPDFFNFMKVEEQIKWNERLWCISSWGSKANKNSGLYSYICNFYNIPFHSYSKYCTLTEISKLALLDLNDLNIEPCFDYILIDESQDFPEEFIKLCEKVTKYQIFVAGDIFQKIFDIKSVKELNPNFLLNKCYRTDPKTLMFAHGLGMGLFEKNKISWLEKKEWEACGYEIQEIDKKYVLTRNPLRRFEDLKLDDSVEVYSLEDDIVKYNQKIIDILRNIKEKFTTVMPDDIAIIFLEETNNNYQLMDFISSEIYNEFNWEVNKGYETKEKKENTILVSNRNNIKGLEFPFIICVSTEEIDSNLNKRNSLYMILTRSFLKTYFIFSKDNNTEEFIDALNKGLENIRNGKLEVSIPTEKEKEKIETNIKMFYQPKKSLNEIIDEEIIKQKIEKKYITELKEQIIKKLKNLDTSAISKEKITEMIKKYYEFLKLN